LIERLSKHSASSSSSLSCPWSPCHALQQHLSKHLVAVLLAGADGLRQMGLVGTEDCSVQLSVEQIPVSWKIVWDFRIYNREWKSRKI
jgi:hypothetical protein